MSKHAPAPWSVDIANVLLGVEHGDEISDLVGNRVCEVSPLSSKLPNAYLIAAAPDLLEALESLYNAVDSCVDLTPEVMLHARIAIEKAKRSI